MFTLGIFAAGFGAGVFVMGAISRALIRQDQKDWERVLNAQDATIRLQKTNATTNADIERMRRETPSLN